MKMMIVVALALVAAVCAGPVPNDKDTTIVTDVQSRNEDGSYKYVVETSDGNKKEEEGVVKIVNDEDNKPKPVIIVKGSYEYVNDKGELDAIKYYADELGYHAEGPSVPKN